MRSSRQIFWPAVKTPARSAGSLCKRPVTVKAGRP